MTLVSTPSPEGKREIRRRVVATRLAKQPTELAGTADQLASRATTLVEHRRASTLTAFVSADGEPGTLPLIDRLTASGVRVLLPLLCEDFDLEWALYVPGGLAVARFGIMQPTGPSLGKAAISEAGLVFCPGVAGTERGERLGRGGGSYDRALTRADPAATRCLLLYDDEVLGAVPIEPHDELVDYICTPTRLIEASTGRLEHQGGVGR